MSTMFAKSSLTMAGLCLLVSCGAALPPDQSGNRHLQPPEPVRTSEIPAVVTPLNLLPAPEAQASPELYSIVVQDVSVRELLFAVARDAGINIDVHPGVSGTGKSQCYRSDSSANTRPHRTPGRHTLVPDRCQWSDCGNGLSLLPDLSGRLCQCLTRFKHRFQHVYFPDVYRWRSECWWGRQQFRGVVEPEFKQQFLANPHGQLASHSGRERRRRRFFEHHYQPRERDYYGARQFSCTSRNSGLSRQHPNPFPVSGANRGHCGGGQS